MTSVAFSTLSPIAGCKFGSKVRYEEGTAVCMGGVEAGFVFLGDGFPEQRVLGRRWCSSPRERGRKVADLTEEL